MILIQNLIRHLDLKMQFQTLHFGLGLLNPLW